MSFISDPYQPDELELRITRNALEIAAEHKVPIQILTKGGTRAVPDFPLLAATGKQAAFACTLTVCDKAWAAKLEPPAAEPEDRLNALKAAHKAGITTWVSFELSIDEHSVIQFIRITHPYIDLYKVGAISGDKTIPRFSMGSIACVPETGRHAENVTRCRELHAEVSDKCLGNTRCHESS